MIDVKAVVENLDLMRNNLSVRGVAFELADIVNLHDALKQQKQKLEALQKDANAITKKITGSAIKCSRNELVGEGLIVKGLVADAKAEYGKLECTFSALVSGLPNWISPDVPLGETDKDNRVVRQVGAVPAFDFAGRDHVEIGRSLDLIDFDSGTKVAGSKFYFLKNHAVILQHAIKSYVFEKAMKAGFVPLQTPDISYNHILEGVGFAPRGEESNTYLLDGLEKSLIATAEICVGGMHSNEVIDSKKLPLLYVAESHCFRREAGAAGRSSKGLYRVHQFEKIELFVICEPHESDVYHEKILTLQEEIYSEMNIPYQVVLNCSGDLGAPAYKKYDLEAWMPGKGESGEYGEITSASNCTDYQARRLGIKFKNPVTKKNEYVHTLNGTASALGRTMITILENFQTSGGEVEIPEVLKKYLPFDSIGLAK